MKKIWYDGRETTGNGEGRLKLYHGSPEDLTGRSEREKRAYRFLDELGVDFVRTDHPDTPATTMEVCAEVDAVLGVHICKNLFLCNRQKTSFYLLIMPGDKPFKTKELSKQMGISRLSFAGEEAMAELLDVRPGSVSVLGLMNDHDRLVQLVIDEDVLKEEQFGCHPCENTSSIRFATADLTEKILPALHITPVKVRLQGWELSIDALDGSDDGQIAEMSVLASAIIKKYYDPLLGADQNDYMIDMFQSEHAIREQLSHGYRYFFVRANGEDIGFLAFYPRGDALYLSKWYLRSDMRGRGFARKMLDFLSQEAKALGLCAIELNVNKHNKTTAVYEKLGFVKIRDEKNDIGHGYYMDDYVYRLSL